MKNSFMMYIFFGSVFLNITGYFLGDFIKDYLSINLFIDSIGTILSGLVLGPFFGGVTGLLSNLILGVIHNPVNIPFAIVSILIGVTAGIVGRIYGYKSIKSILICIISVAFITSLSGAVVAYFVFGGATGARIDLNMISLIEAGYRVLVSSFIVRLPMNIMDKGISILIVLFIIWLLKLSKKDQNSKI